MAVIGPKTTANGRQYRRIASSFTRENNATPYVSGDLVADVAAAASVTPFSWALGGHASLLPSIHLHKTDVTGDLIYRAYVFATSPTVSTTGDNGVFKDNVNNAANCMAIYEGTVYGFKDGAVGVLVPIHGVIELEYVGDPVTIYGLLEVRSAWTPLAQAVITATLRQEFLP